MIKDEDLMWWLGFGGKLNYLPKDITVKCPKCDANLYKVTKDKFKGEVLHTEELIPVNSKIPSLVPRSLMVCPFCTSVYGKFGQVHTIIGWIPNA